MNDIYNQIFKLQENNDGDESVTIEYINKIVNPFEFIHSNVPGSTISVSKVKPDSIIFFELMELFQVFNINDVLSLKHKINIAHLTHNYTSTNYLLNMLREENEDNVISEEFNYDNLYKLFIKNVYQHKLDLIICEFHPEEYNDTKKYINNMVLILLVIIKYQMNNGMCLIKIDNILYKAVIDVIFILSGIYDKIYLVKPSIGNVTKGERYLICKGFNIQHKLLSIIEEHLVSKLNNHELMNDKCINSIIDNELPYYLLNRLEESNLVIGQQQLESLDQIINIFKNKNREDKIENIKKSNIQKSVSWCEKFKIPCNKFAEKTNIFLPIIKEIKEPIKINNEDIEDISDIEDIENIY
jgi:hypothetical protein